MIGNSDSAPPEVVTTLVQEVLTSDSKGKQPSEGPDGLTTKAFSLQALQHLPAPNGGQEQTNPPPCIGRSVTLNDVKIMGKWYNPRSWIRSWTSPPLLTSDSKRRRETNAVISGETGIEIWSTVNLIAGEKQAPRRETNIVIFGETGVGKSSIINLIAGEKKALTSNAALGCTFGHEHYPVQLDDVSFVLWDTAGLDEGSEGTVPAEEAGKNLSHLLENLSHSGGIHLLIYCIRGARLTKTLKYNYDLFYVMVCRRKVPIALVVTGLEHQKDKMETWWTQNEAELHRNRMRFDGHACVTSLGEDIQGEDIQARRLESRNQLQELVQSYSKTPGWRVDAQFIAGIVPSFRKLFVHSPRDSLGQATKVRKVVVCGSFPGVFPGTTLFWDKGSCEIGSMVYDFLRVDKGSLHNVASEDFKGAGLIIFYTSALTENRLELTDIAVLKELHDLGGGQGCPVIVILWDCNDKGVAWSCRHQIVSAHHDIRPHVIISSDAGEKMIQTIEAFYLEPIEGEVQTANEKPHEGARK